MYEVQIFTQSRLQNNISGCLHRNFCHVYWKFMFTSILKLTWSILCILFTWYFTPRHNHTDIYGVNLPAKAETFADCRVVGGRLTKNIKRTDVQKEHAVNRSKWGMLRVGQKFSKQKAAKKTDTNKGMLYWRGMWQWRLEAKAECGEEIG